MSLDPLNLLESQPIPPPNSVKKAETILAAREKFSETRQGKVVGRRLLHVTNFMENFMTRQKLMRGTALATILAVLTVGGISVVHQPERRSYGGGGMALSEGGGGAGSLNDMLTTTSSNSHSPLSAITNLFAKEEKTTGTGGYSGLDATVLDGTPSPEYARGVEQQKVARADQAQSSGSSAMPTPMSSQVAGESDADPLREFEETITPKMRAASPPPAKTVGNMAMTLSQPMPQDMVMQEENRDKFAGLPDNPWSKVAAEPVSTFSADVDTASYSVVRRMLRQGQLPQRNAVRLEELVNYFDYDYSVPTDKSKPFQPTVAIYPTPWNAGTKLIHVGIKAYDVQRTERPHANIVLLVDVSGSMSSQDKLPLAKSSFKMLVENLQPTDTISIVTYAGSESIALEPTKVEDKQRILSVIDSLGAGGSTAGAAGLRSAYELAKRNFDKEGINRVILATDGDFNVGVSDPGGLAGYVANERKSGVFLSVLGFGMGNYQDVMMQSLAQNGNGTAAYIDTLTEARRVLNEELESTLFTVAKDVKFQVEFNPNAVTSYRLLGYETRALKREDFDNDKVDAGDMGAGHEVTAIYEITTVDTPPAADTRFAPKVEAVALPEEIAFLKMRYKLPESETSQLITRPVTKADLADLSEASTDVRFAASVAGFAQLLRGAAGMKGFTFADVEKLAQGAKGEDKFGHRAEFLELARLAGSLSTPALSKEEGGVAFPPPQQ